MLTTLEEGTLPLPDFIAAPRSARKLENVGKASFLSGINKQPHDGKVELCDVGVPGDSIDYPYHGGIEKALHQYCAAHYPKWRAEKPDKAHLFKVGAFGENISLSSMHEENTCIGDTYQIGSEVMVQVSDVRMPCYKLNARFDWPQAARKVQKTGRIGWYYRILKTGAIQEGDRMALVERLNPRWTVRNTARVLLDKHVDDALVAELIGVEGLGAEMKTMAERRLGGQMENTMARTKGGAFDWNPYEIEEARMVTPRIRELTFAYRGPKDRLITDAWHSHEYVNLRFGPDNSIQRSYSVVTGDSDRFVLGIALDDHTRGGSKFLHESVQVGDRLDVVKGDSIESATPPDGFDPEKSISRHIFVIGGIGITAFLRTITDLHAAGQHVEVHYACRSLAQAAYRDRLPAERTTFYPKDEGRRLNLPFVIPPPGRGAGTHDCMIYACGPNGLLDAAEKLCDELGYPTHLRNIESFGAPVSGPLGEPFEALVDDGEREGGPVAVKVPAEQSFLDALTEAGFDVPSSCRAGRCGICVVNVKCGRVEHKGIGLLEEAKATSMLSCVSRGKGKIEIEIE